MRLPRPSLVSCPAAAPSTRRPGRRTLSSTSSGLRPAAVLRQVPRVFTVASDHPARLSSFLSLNVDCSLAAYYTVRIVVPPAHGTASVEQGRYFPNYPAANPHSACNGSPHDGVALSYRSSPSYVGPDLTEVEAIAPDGHAQTIDYHLKVK